MGSEGGEGIRQEKKEPALPSPGVPVVDVATLLGEGREVRLLHRGQEYRLRVTRQGKLILTK